ncbi:MAG: LPXTG cell wall anchor domain-containing protein [Candidatus Staskawiczbacteria bacterium]|nr:LPXTG cell wall anchor domain-containing protein [Candidatus Staskawiczbacteria bacterium]
MKKIIVILILGSFCFLTPEIVFAKTDLSISETDISFSKDTILNGDIVRIYSRVFNLGDNDVSGFVSFSTNNKEIGVPQPISLRPNTYDDVFVDWKPVAGKYSITAKIVGQNMTDDDLKNNITAKKDVVVDSDINHNSIADKNEPTALSQNNSNTNNSTANQTDNTNNNNDTNNSDTASLYKNIQKNIDNFAVSNPIKSGIESLDQAINNQASKIYDLAFNNKSSKNNKDSAFSVNPLLFGASLLDSISGFFGGNKNYAYLVMGALSLLVIFFLFFKKKKRKRL